MEQTLEAVDQKMFSVMATTPDDDIIQASLEFVRKHLDMDVAYLSKIVDDHLVFQRVSAPGFEAVISVGDIMPLDRLYCPHILAGRLPELIPDTADVPFAQTIALTHELPIGSHVSIPVKRADGSTYGMFCCLSTRPRPSLNQRDHDVVSAFARIAGETINGVLSRAAEKNRIESRIRTALDSRAFSVVYQPIVEAESSSIKGFEALCRFEGDPYVSPDLWFVDAAKVGLQVELELCVIEKALQALHDLPGDIYLSVNASPQTILTGRLRGAVNGWPIERLVLELTEHEAVSSYEGLLRELSFLRQKGLRIAIDDAGAGYSGLQQIVKLSPDIIKLDMSLTSNIDTDVVRKSLAIAMLQFAKETNALIIAEGVETEGELATLRKMSVDLVQGYLLGRPQGLEHTLALCAASPERP